MKLFTVNNKVVKINNNYKKHRQPRPFYQYDGWYSTSLALLSKKTGKMLHCDSERVVSVIE